MWIILAGLLGIFLTLVLPWLFLPWYIAVTFFVVFLSWRPTRSEWVRKSFVGPSLRSASGYNFQRIEGSAELNADGQYIFAMHPHGLFCFAEMLTFVFDSPYTPIDKFAHETVPLVASELMWMPILGHWVCALGCESVDRENMTQLLQQKKSVAITPGGVREVKYTPQCTTTQIVLLKSLQFLKLAFAKKDVSVVPILTVGESACYTFLPSSNVVQNFFIKLVGWPFPMLAFGRWFTFLPGKNSHTTLLMGSPISPDNIDTVEEFEEMYYAELSRIAQSKNVELHFVDRNGKIVEATGAVVQERSETSD